MISDKDLCEIRNAMSWVKTFQIAKVNTDKTSITRVIPKTIHYLIFAFRATNAVLDPGRAQPSWRPWPQERPLLKLSIREFKIEERGRRQARRK